jgi:ribonuclease D
MMTPKPQQPNTNLTISHDEIHALPLEKFKGKIVLISEEKKLQRAFAEISEHEAIGFDTETRPSFKKGQLHKVSLMQVATPEKVFLMRLNYTGITPSLIDFLENDLIQKAGVGIRDDLKALSKLAQFQAHGFTELSTLAREAGLQVESVKKLTALLLGFRISKGAQTSNWEAPTLTQKQLEYAATDAWVCLEIFNKLLRNKDL